MSSIEVFICYAPKDESILKELVIHLRVLKRQGILTVWYDREISPGTEWEQEKDKHLNTARIILLFISQYFVDSDYCYLVQMEQAVQRHKRGEARVIPILVRPVHYEKTPFAQLQPLPTDGKPIKQWRDREKAIFNVAEGIRRVAEELDKGE